MCSPDPHNASYRLIARTTTGLLHKVVLPLGGNLVQGRCAITKRPNLTMELALPSERCQGPDLDRLGGADYAAKMHSLDQAAHVPPVVKSHCPNTTGVKPGATLHPLGPIVYRVAARRPAAARAVAVVVFAGCVALLSAAVWLTPDTRGLGTHEQLGHPPCTVVLLTGYPCPTCGMTTAFAHTVRGELLSAFRAQPAGLAMALATIVTACVSLSVVLSGRVWTVNWYRVSPARVTLALILLILGGWICKLTVGLMAGTLPVGG